MDQDHFVAVRPSNPARFCQAKQFEKWSSSLENQLSTAGAHFSCQLRPEHLISERYDTYLCPEPCLIVYPSVYYLTDPYVYLFRSAIGAPSCLSSPAHSCCSRIDFCCKIITFNFWY